MKKLGYIFGISLLFFGLTGFDPFKSPLIGKWRTTNGQSEVIFTFKEDGTFTANSHDITNLPETQKMKDTSQSGTWHTAADSNGKIKAFDWFKEQTKLTLEFASGGGLLHQKSKAQTYTLRFSKMEGQTLSLQLQGAGSSGYLSGDLNGEPLTLAEEAGGSYLKMEG